MAVWGPKHVVLIGKAKVKEKLTDAILTENCM
jgi:hypothetical protein